MNKDICLQKATSHEFFLNSSPYHTVSAHHNPSRIHTDTYSREGTQVSIVVKQMS